MQLLNIKKTNSQIIKVQNNEHRNKSQLSNFNQNKNQSKQNISETQKHHHDINSQNKNNQVNSQYLRRITIHEQQLKKRTVYAEDFKRTSTNYMKFSNKIKLPNSLVQTLRKQAKQSGKYKQRQQQQIKSSKLGKMIRSKLKKQQKQCQICMSIIKKQVKITDCRHIFCNDCLQQYITFKIKMFEQVLCPQENCNLRIDMNCEIYKNLSQQLKKQYEKIHQFYITSNDPSLRLCPKQNCDGVIKIIQNQPKICNKCQKQFCGLCYFEKHQGQCDKNQIQFFQNNLNYRQCSNCNAVVQKTQGCNHITCRCKYQFCYLCGKKWTGYDHICNAQNHNIFRQNDCCCQCECCCQVCQCLACCECCNCCGCCQCCSDIFFSILQFIAKVLLTLVFFIIVILVLLNNLLLCIFYLIVTIFAGMFGYSTEFICNLCDQDKTPLAILMIIFIPIPMCIGIQSAFKEIFFDLVKDCWSESYQSFKDGLEAIWE